MLDHISSWAENWQLPLSLSKCSFMRVSNRNTETQFVFSLANAELVEMDEITDLGVIFDSKLKFSTHITSIIAKAKQRLFLVHKSFVCKDPTILILAFKTYVLPILDYCSPVWSPYNATDISRIESIQRVFTKRLIGYAGLTYNERLVKSSLCRLELRRLHADLTLCFRVLHNLTVLKWDNMFTFEKPKLHRMGHCWKLRSKRARLDTRLHFFANRTVRVWNKLTSETVCCSSVQAFKARLITEDLSPFMSANRC